MGFATGLGLVATLSELDPKRGLFFTSCELDHLVALHFCKELEVQKKISGLEKKSLSLNEEGTQKSLEYLRADFCDREGELFLGGAKNLMTLKSMPFTKMLLALREIQVFGPMNGFVNLEKFAKKRRSSLPTAQLRQSGKA